MPSVEHVEKHFTATAAVRDIVIGMSDGLTVPFALAAGLTGAVAATARGLRSSSPRGSRKLPRDPLPWAWRISSGEDGFRALRVRARPRISRNGGAAGSRNRRSGESLSRVRDVRAANAAGGYRNHFEPETLGGFHDALRARPGSARSGARGPQRGYDCCVVYRRRAGSAGALYFDEASGIPLCGFRSALRCWRCSYLARSKATTRA